MPAVFAAALIAAGGVGAWWGIHLERSGPEPNSPVVFRETHHDFGKLDLDVSATHEFLFTNVGREDVAVSKVHTTCGCIVDDTTPRPVKQGQQGSVVVTLSTSGAKPFRHLQKRIVVTFDGEKVKPIPLMLSADIMPDVIVEPGVVKFVETAPRAIEQKELRIRNNVLDSKSFADVRLVGSAPYYELTELQRRKTDFRVRVKLLPNIAPSVLAPLRVSYEKEGHSRTVCVAVEWERPERVEVVPSHYVVAADRSMSGSLLRKATRRRFQLVSADYPQLIVTDISIASGQEEDIFGWEFQQNDPDGHFSVWMDALPKTDTGLHYALLRVSCKDRAADVVEYVLLDTRVLISTASGNHAE